MSDAILITFHIDDIVKFPGCGESTIANAVEYRTPGISTQRLIAIYHDYREHVVDARRRYGTDHYKRSEIVMSLKLGREHQECVVTGDLAELAAVVDSIETNPELGADDRRRLMPIINSFPDYLTWCAGNVSKKEAA